LSKVNRRRSLARKQSVFDDDTFGMLALEALKRAPIVAGCSMHASIVVIPHVGQADRSIRCVDNIPK
jgi:hypothetical protein